VCCVPAHVLNAPKSVAKPVAKPGKAALGPFPQGMGAVKRTDGWLTPKVDIPTPAPSYGWGQCRMLANGIVGTCRPRAECVVPFNVPPANKTTDCPGPTECCMDAGTRYIDGVDLPYGDNIVDVAASRAITVKEMTCLKVTLANAVIFRGFQSNCRVDVNLVDNMKLADKSGLLTDVYFFPSFNEAACRAHNVSTRPADQVVALLRAIDGLRYGRVWVDVQSGIGWTNDYDFNMQVIKDVVNAIATKVGSARVGIHTNVAEWQYVMGADASPVSAGFTRYPLWYISHDWDATFNAFPAVGSKFGPPPPASGWWKAPFVKQFMPVSPRCGVPANVNFVPQYISNTGTPRLGSAVLIKPAPSDKLPFNTIMRAYEMCDTVKDCATCIHPEFNAVCAPQYMTDTEKPYWANYCCYELPHSNGTRVMIDLKLSRVALPSNDPSINATDSSTARITLDQLSRRVERSASHQHHRQRKDKMSKKINKFFL